MEEFSTLDIPYESHRMMDNYLSLEAGVHEK